MKEYEGLYVSSRERKVKKRRSQQRGPIKGNDILSQGPGAKNRKKKKEANPGRTGREFGGWKEGQ